MIICCTFSCKKELMEGGNEVTYNSHRVKRIVTHGIGKEDYQLLFNYSSTGTLTRAYICGAAEEIIEPEPSEDSVVQKPIIKRDTLGYLSKGKNDLGDLYQIYDYVINIDKDSVARIQAAHPETYKDTLKRRVTSRLAYQILTDFKKTSQLKEETESKFMARADFGVGKEFNNQYLNDSKNVYKYEYKDDKVIIVRHAGYKYNPEIKLNDKFEKVITKTEFTYSGDNIATVTFYELLVGSEENWTKKNSYDYTYSDGTLMGIKGNEFNYIRTSDQITITNSGNTDTYTIDKNGNIVRIDYANGSFSEIEYESGHGNFSDLYVTNYSKLLGMPFIK